MAGIKKICLVGFDRQIGSFALGLRRTGFSGQIIGVADNQTVNACWKLGMISDGTNNLEEALPGSNLIMLSSVSTQVSVKLPDVVNAADDEAIISEMTRVKGDVNRVFESSGRDDVHYVGFRMIGDVVQNNDYTKADRFFFVGKTIILTPRDKRDLDAFSQLQEIMRKMGASVVAMSPQAHDRLLAQVHHVPKAAVIAVLQRLFAGADNYTITPEMMGSWLSGETRELVQSQSHGWVDEVESNRELVLEGIDELIARLVTLKDDIMNGNLGSKLEHIVEQAPEALKETNGDKGYELILSAGPDPKNLERVSEILVKARLKVGKLDRMEHAATGTYRLMMTKQEDGSLAMSLLRQAGFEVVEIT